jgi:hypothetical protein
VGISWPCQGRVVYAGKVVSNHADIIVVALQNRPVHPVTMGVGSTGCAQPGLHPLGHEALNLPALPLPRTTRSYLRR